MTSPSLVWSSSRPLYAVVPMSITIGPSGNLARNMRDETVGATETGSALRDNLE
jgi:hypothetical protein